MFWKTILRPGVSEKPIVETKEHVCPGVAFGPPLALFAAGLRGRPLRAPSARATSITHLRRESTFLARAAALKMGLIKTKSSLGWPPLQDTRALRKLSPEAGRRPPAGRGALLSGRARGADADAGPVFETLLRALKRPRSVAVIWGRLDKTGKVIK